MGWLKQSGLALILAASQVAAQTQPAPYPVISRATLTDTAKIKNLPFAIAEELRLDGNIGRLDSIVIHTDPANRKNNPCKFTKDFAYSGLQCGNIIVLTAEAGQKVVAHEIGHLRYRHSPYQRWIVWQFDSLHTAHNRISRHMSLAEENHYFNSRNDSIPKKFFNSDSLCATGLLATHAAANINEDIAMLIETAKVDPNDLLRCSKPLILGKVNVLIAAELVPQEVRPYLDFIKSIGNIHLPPADVVKQTLAFIEQYPKSRYVGLAMLYGIIALDKREECKTRQRLTDKGQEMQMRSVYLFTNSISRCKEYEVGQTLDGEWQNPFERYQNRRP